MAQNNEAVREFTFEEYVSQYKNDAVKLFSEENEGCETDFANFIVRCGLRIIQLANETINRQKAEIERLQRENYILSINADTAFQDGLNEAQDLYAEEVKEQVKVEAVKEFAEKLKFEIINTPFVVNCTGENDDFKEGCLRGLVAKQNNIIDMIDTALKEMVGESNG